MSHQREVLNALSEAPPLHTRLLFHGQFQEGAHIVGFDLHPVKPLLATATEEGAVIIWNYEKGATVYQFSLAAYEEEKGSSKKGGALRCIRFYDHHTRHWKGVLQRQHRGQSDFKALPKLPPWVVIVSETTVIFVDYVTRASREIPLAQLDNKTITCVDYFAYSNLMAFGGSDGQVRLWDTLQWRRAERLQGGQSKAVASLFTYEEDDGTHHLIVAGEEGKFSFWKWKPAGLESYTLNNRTLGGSTSEASSSASSNFDQNTFSVAASVAEASHSLTPPLSSRTSYEEKNDGRGAQVSTVQPFGGQQRKVHDGSLCGATFDSYTGTLITSGSDKTICIWDVANYKEVARKRTTLKQVWTQICHWPHPRFPLNSLLVVPKDDPKIYVARAHCAATEDASAAKKDANNMRAIIDTDSFPSPVKKSRVLFLACHPLRPNIVACCTRGGVFVTSVEAFSSPDFALSAASAKTKPSVYYLANQGDTIMSLDHKNTAVKQLVLNRKGATHLRISPSKRFLSVFWEEVYHYQILDTHTWKSVCEGTVCDFAWFSDSDRFAILEITSDVTDAADPRKKKKKNKNELPRLVPWLRFYEVTTNGPVPSYVPLSFKVTDEYDELCALYGGPQLCMGFGPPSPDDKPSIAALIAAPKTCRFLSWENKALCGDPFVAPRLLLWDSTQQFCVMCYDTHFCIYSLRPTLRAVCRLPFRVISALWYNHTLIFTTEHEIRCVIAKAPRFGTILLADHDTVSSEGASSVQIQRLLSSENSNDGFTLQDVPVLHRPVGSISLVKVDDEDLIVLDASFHVHALPIFKEAALKFYILAGAGQFEMALSWATHVSPLHHPKMAKFLMLLNQPLHVLQLSGLDLLQKLSICVEHGFFAEGIELLFNSTNNADGGEIQRSTFTRMAVLLAQFALQASQPELAAKALKLASSIDPSMNQHLALFYAKVGQEDNLKALLSELLSADSDNTSSSSFGMEEVSNFVASVVHQGQDDDNKENLIHKLLQTDSYSEACALACTKKADSSAELDNFVEGWNDALEPSTSGASAAPQQPNFPFTFQAATRPTGDHFSLSS